jgi:hypothetical protein
MWKDLKAGIVVFRATDLADELILSIWKDYNWMASHSSRPLPVKGDLIRDIWDTNKALSCLLQMLTEISEGLV